MENFKSIDILLVEDNEDDILIIQRAFKKVHLLNGIHIVRNGQEALDFIFRKGRYADAEHPTVGLILLDINMPGLNGFQVLKRLKEHPIYKVIPVIMLTVSDDDEDIIRSYQNGAVSYIIKKSVFDN